MKAGYIQFTPIMYNVEKNIEKLQSFVEDNLNETVDLLVLPELALTGYAYTTKDELRKVSSEKYNLITSDFMMKLAKITGAHIVMGYPEAAGDNFYNSALFCNKDKVIGNYRKTHLFGGEKDVYLYGDSGLNVFETPFGKVGVMICFDWFFPEAARTLALKGAEIIAHPSNLVMPYCQRAMFARSLENSVFTITANRCGTETWGTPLTFTGQSIIYDPRGNILAHGQETGDEIKIVEIDPEVARNKNLNSKNHIFNERRTDYYSV